MIITLNLNDFGLAVQCTLYSSVECSANTIRRAIAYVRMVSQWRNLIFRYKVCTNLSSLFEDRFYWLVHSLPNIVQWNYQRTIGKLSGNNQRVNETAISRKSLIVRINHIRLYLVYPVDECYPNTTQCGHTLAIHRQSRCGSTPRQNKLWVTREWPPQWSSHIQPAQQSMQSRKASRRCTWPAQWCREHRRARMR